MLKKWVLLPVLVGFLLQTSCKSENPNPELLDPIYLDLVKLHKNTKKEWEDELKKEPEILKGLSEATPRTREVKAAKKELSAYKKKVIQLEQMTKYYEIRAEHRRLVSRKQYRIAFKKGEAWPNPKDYEYYLQNQKLRAADLNWQSRVPKLFKNNPNYIPGQKQAKEGEDKKKGGSEAAE